MKIKSAFVAVIALGFPLSAFGQEKPKPMKVYVFAGQSNMTGMARTRTLEHIKMFPDTAEKFADLFDKDGKPVTLDEVYVSQWMDKESGRLEPKYGGGKGGGFGPEYAFGIYMHKKLKEPFLIIKTSLGGSSLSYRYRSPSSGTWTPPPGHPDLTKEEKEVIKLPKLALPGKLELAENWTPEKPHALQRRHMGLKNFKGAEIGKVGDLFPIYVMTPPTGELKGAPFQKGDLILGIEGSGLREDPLEQWRDILTAWHILKSVNRVSIWVSPVNLTKICPNGDDHAYSYDALGRMATHTTPNNHVCTYTYDLRDRQTLADWNTTTPDTTKEYFANGLLNKLPGIQSV